MSAAARLPLDGIVVVAVESGRGALLPVPLANAGAVVLSERAPLWDVRHFIEKTGTDSIC